MKAKCPYCREGCDRCDKGFVAVQMAEGEWWERRCVNETCNHRSNGVLVVGGHSPIKELPQEYGSPHGLHDCAFCGSITEWINLDATEG